LKALVPNETGPITRLQLLVPAIAMGDPARFSAPDDAEHERARRLILRMASSLALRADVARLKRALRAPSVANALCEALGIASKDAAVDALNQLLILVADHELNVSTLAARAAASAGADLYGCISAALAALSGPRHGGNCDRIEALVREAEKPDRATNAVRARTRRGEQIPGFGHPLYASGDPRTRPLLDAARALRCRSPSFSTLMSIVDVMQTEGREAPTLDLGIVAISLALSLPESSATALFALGRSAGWVAHVLEQRSEGYPLRPRARYVGV
jgi:citrate synthase